jgi:hypothetical protein
MASVKKEVERGAINGSSFRSQTSIMGRTYYLVKTLKPPIGHEDTCMYFSGYCVHYSEIRRTDLYNGVALSSERQPSQRRRTIFDRVL